MVFELWLPILLSAIALFLASFLSWMILPIHFNDWRKLEREDEFLDAVRGLNLQQGNYMFPGWNKPDEMKSAEFQEKTKAGHVGVMTILPPMNMGRNLILTFIYFLVVSFCLGYLATLANPRDAGFEPVFRFVTTAGILTFLASIVQHAIWFRNRISGHVVESFAYAMISGAIFGALWSYSL